MGFLVYFQKIYLTNSILKIQYTLLEAYKETVCSVSVSDDRK